MNHTSCQFRDKHTVGGIVFYKHAFLVSSWKCGLRVLHTLHRHVVLVYPPTHTVHRIYMYVVLLVRMSVYLSFTTRIRSISWKHTVSHNTLLKAERDMSSHCLQIFWGILLWWYHTHYRSCSITSNLVKHNETMLGYFSSCFPLIFFIAILRL